MVWVLPSILVQVCRPTCTHVHGLACLQNYGNAVLIGLLLCDIVSLNTWTVSFLSGVPLCGHWYSAVVPRCPPTDGAVRELLPGWTALHRGPVPSQVVCLVATLTCVLAQVSSQAALVTACWPGSFHFLGVASPH